MKKNLKQFLFPFLLIILTSLALKPLFSNRLLYSDDAQLHAARVANYYLAAKQGQILPRWAPNLSDGYGYPVFNFTYPLPYLIGTFIYMALPVTLVMSLNLTIILLTVTGVLGVYFLAKKFSLSSWHALLAATLYLTAPYTLINIYSRTALGELAFFAFLPWVMWEIEHFIRDKKVKPIVFVALIVDLTLLLISHQASLIITFPILVTYYWLRTKNKKKLIALLKQIVPLGIISLLFTAWYWLPALWEKQFIILDRAGTITNYLTQFPQHLSFFFHQITNLDRLNTFKMVSIGYSSWIVFLSALLLSRNKRLPDLKIIWFLLGVMILTTILMMPLSRPLWLISGLGNYLQYPWRLLSLIILGTILLFLHLAQTKLFKRNRLIVGLIIVTSLTSVLVYGRPRGFESWSDYELFEYFKTTTTFNEFQPIWAAEYTKHFPEEKISFRKSGQKLYEDEVFQAANYAKLEVQDWSGSQMNYIVKTDESVEVIQKTYYFPGWELIIDDQPQAIQYQDQEFPGHIVYGLKPGEHQMQLKFTQNTPARKTGNYLVLLGILGLSLYLLPIRKP